MNQQLQDLPHRLGVTFATVVILVGIAWAAIELSQQAKPTDVLELGAYTLGAAVLLYLVVRIVGWVFGELMASTREQRARRL